VRSINGGSRMRWRRRGGKATFNDACIRNITQALPPSTPTCSPQRAGRYQAATPAGRRQLPRSNTLPANNSRRAARSPSCEYHWPMTC
jgi:hypothetical protein